MGELKTNEMVIMYWIVIIVAIYILRCIAMNQHVIAKNQVRIHKLLEEINSNIKNKNENKTTQKD